MLKLSAKQAGRAGLSLLVFSLAALPGYSASQDSRQCKDQTEDFTAMLEDITEEAAQLSLWTNQGYRNVFGADATDALYDDLSEWNDSVTSPANLVFNSIALDKELYEPEYDYPVYASNGAALSPSTESWQKGNGAEFTRDMKGALSLAADAMSDAGARGDLGLLNCVGENADSSLETALSSLTLDPTAVAKFQTTGLAVCKTLHVLSEMQYRQDVIEDIGPGGYPISALEWEHKDSYDGNNNTARHFADLRLYSEFDNAPYKDSNTSGVDMPLLGGDRDELLLSYREYYSFSDRGANGPFAFQFRLGDLSKSSYVCTNQYWVTTADHGDVKAELCVKLLDLDDSSITLQSDAVFHYKGDENTLTREVMTIPVRLDFVMNVLDAGQGEVADLKDKIAKTFMKYLSDFTKLEPQADKLLAACAS